MEIWYYEEEDSSLRYSYKIKDVLYRGQSEFQKVDVVDTVAYGPLLLLDGLVMLTSHDEFVYHELIAHVPALLHKNPKKVVVIGGGDGGTVRELLKHPSIEEIVLCEIDSMVVDISKKYFPEVASGLDNDRVKVNIADGVAYIKELEPSSVDMIIIDSTDPIGPGEGLFTGDFYRSVSKALKQDGYMVCQSESPWHSGRVLKNIRNNIAEGFSNVKSYIGGIPTYPRGLWSFTIASHSSIQCENYDRSRYSDIKPSLKYLSEELLTSSFALPLYYKRKLGIED